MSEVVTTSNNSVLASFIERAARDPEFDVQKFGELLRMQREVENDQARKSFNRAMASAQAEMLPVVRDATNSHLNNRYAKLETIDAAIRPIYTRWGFSVRYGSAPSPHEGWLRITCTVAHDDGYFEENYLDAPVSLTGSQGGRMAVTPVQAIGSTVTYLRRYLLGMVWNTVLADDDDDGEATRRAAAAPMPRGARVAERAPAYEGTPSRTMTATLNAERTDAQWRVWLDKLRAACEVLYHRSEVVEVAERPSVADALANGPEWVRREISEVLAENYKRFASDEPTEEELGEVEIAGAEKLAAG
jgi:ERF superfamily